MRRFARRLALAGVCLALATPAAADTHGEAEQLFRDGKDLLKAGRVAEACTAFEASQRLDPSLATLMNLADCREKNQQLATAWSLFLQVVTKTRADATYASMGEIALQRASTLEPRLSHLTINVADDSRIDGLVIERNGDAVDAATWGRAISVDGGHYVVTASAPGHEPWKVEIDVKAEVDRKSIDVPRLRVATTTDVDNAPVDGAAGTAGSGGRRKLALGVAAGAAVSLGVAVAFELSGRSTYKEYEGMPENTELYDRANGKHHIAQAAAVVGIAAAGGAAYLWLTGTHASDGRAALIPLVTPGATGLAITRGF